MFERVLPRAGWAIAILALARNADAEPMLAIEAEGVCPTRTELVAAFEARHIAVGGSNWRLRVRASADATRLRLEDPQGAVVLDREVQSGDCTAVASAVALMIEAQFVKIGIIVPRGAEDQPRSPELEPPRAPAPAENPSTVPEARQQPPSTPWAPSASAPRGHPPRWLVFAAMGPELLVPRPVATMAGSAGLALEWNAYGLVSGLEAFSMLPGEITVGSDSVQRWTGRLLLEIGLSMGRRPSFEPWLGAGGSVARVEAPGLVVHAAQTVWSPVVAWGLALTQPLGRSSWYGRAVLGCYALVRREQYLVSSASIGDGPRGGCNLTYGLAWSSTPELPDRTPEDSRPSRRSAQNN